MISFSAVWVALAEVPATTSAFYRVFFGFLALLVMVVVSGEYKRFTLRPRLVFITLCGVAFSLDLFFWHSSILFVGPGLATILGNFQVFLMAAAGIFFFGERLHFRFLISMPMAMAGLLLIIGLDWSQLSASYKTGIFYGFLTALCYAVFMLLLRNIQKADSTSRYSPLMHISLICSIFLAIVIKTSNGTFVLPTLTSAVSLICLGIFSQAIGWMLIANAMPKIHASFTGLILLLQPALSFIWDVLFFSRPTAMVHWLGVAITLGAIYLGLTGSNRR